MTFAAVKCFRGDWDTLPLKKEGENIAQRVVVIGPFREESRSD